MEIAIPSKGRAGLCKSQKVLTTAKLYVPELEVAAYQRACPTSVVRGVPDEVKGITKTRNWILDNAEHNWVVMVDDDVKSQGYVEIQPRKCRHRTMTEDQWLREFRRLFEMAEDVGFRVWGVATQGAPRAVYPYRPFLFRSYLTASCLGIRRETGIRFDESFPVKEDYELGLRCVVEDGGIIAARHVHWDNEHWHQDGGCKEYRTQAMEAKCIAKLQALYPGMVRQVNRGGAEYSIEIHC